MGAARRDVKARLARRPPADRQSHEPRITGGLRHRPASRDVTLVTSRKQRNVRFRRGTTGTVAPAQELLRHRRQVAGRRRAVARRAIPLPVRRGRLRRRHRGSSRRGGSRRRGSALHRRLDTAPSWRASSLPAPSTDIRHSVRARPASFIDPKKPRAALKAYALSIVARTSPATLSKCARFRVRSMAERLRHTPAMR